MSSHISAHWPVYEQTASVHSSQLFRGVEGCGGPHRIEPVQENRYVPTAALGTTTNL